MENDIIKSDIKPKRFHTRAEWRQWLQENFDKEFEVWFMFPLKASGETVFSYNDAVEEALCFGWIDSTIKAFDGNYKIQRFSRRNPRSSYSQSNKERLKWLYDNGLVHSSIMESAAKVLAEPFVYPEDILAAIEADETAALNFKNFSESYKRIRVAYIEAARIRSDEFEKRLNNFIEHTKKGKLISGYGGIDKYY